MNFTSAFFSFLQFKLAFVIKYLFRDIALLKTKQCREGRLKCLTYKRLSYQRHLSCCVEEIRTIT